MKIYNKRGNKSYKENRMLKKLEEVFAKKIAENPEFANTIVPANTPDELKKMFETYCSEEVQDVSMTGQTSTEDQTSTSDQSSDTNPIEDQTETPGRFIDPLNAEEPIVRDYVDKDEFETESTSTNQPVRTDFPEPTSFEGSFELPDENTPKESANQKNQSTQGSQKKEEPKQKSQPVNPDFDTMSAGKKRRSTKKFAKYIVEAVCVLSEKGFVWFANKDINEGKLVEYELSGEMDLNLLVTVDGDQEMTVKQFFLEKCKEAEYLVKIDPTEKADLIDALAEVLLEKGVGPTPSQELMLIALTIFGRQTMSILQIRAETNSVLSQLRAQKTQTYDSFEEEIPSEPRPDRTTEKKEQRAPVDQEHETPTAQEQPITSPVDQTEEALPIVDQPVETKE